MLLPIFKSIKDRIQSLHYAVLIYGEGAGGRHVILLPIIKLIFIEHLYVPDTTLSMVPGFLIYYM